MDAFSIITASFIQAWNTVSMIAIVNSQWLLTTLGYGASTVAVQAAVLGGVALATVAVVATTLYLGSKVLGMIFGSEDEEDEKDDEQEKANKVSLVKKAPPAKEAEALQSQEEVFQAAQDSIAAANCLLAQATQDVQNRDAAIGALNVPVSEKKPLTIKKNRLKNLLDLSKKAVDSTQAAYDAADKAVQATNTLIIYYNQHMSDATLDQKQEANQSAADVKNVKQKSNAALQGAKLTLQRAQEYSEETLSLFAACEEAAKAFQARTDDDELLASLNHATSNFQANFVVIQGKLEHIRNMNPEEVAEALATVSEHSRNQP